MTVNEQYGRRLRARYAFSGATAGLARSAPLAPDEPVLLRGVMNLRGRGILARPTVVRVTPSRLVLLAHYVFQPDRLWDIPRHAVREIEVVRRAVLISWASAHGGVAQSRLAAWTNRPFLDRPLRDVDDIAELLRAWRDSPDADLPERAAASHRHS